MCTLQLVEAKFVRTAFYRVAVIFNIETKKCIPKKCVPTLRYIEASPKNTYTNIVQEAKQIILYIIAY